MAWLVLRFGAIKIKWTFEFYSEQLHTYLPLFTLCTSLHVYKCYFWQDAAQMLDMSWGSLHARPPEESIQFALSVSRCNAAPCTHAAHLTGETGQVLRQLHEAHQKGSPTQHQAGPQQRKQCVLVGVLPVQDGVPGMTCGVCEACWGAVHQSVQAVLHFLNFLLKFHSVHPAFGYVETLWKTRYDSSVIFIKWPACYSWQCWLQSVRQAGRFFFSLFFGLL